MSDYAGEKTLEPTPHRRQQARQEGHVAKSHDLGSAAMLLLGATILLMFGGGLAGFLVEYGRNRLGGQFEVVADQEFCVGLWNSTLGSLSRFLFPILGLIFLAGIAVNVLQTGFLFLPQQLAFDFSRVSPIRGWQRIFSSGGMVRLGFGLLKLAVVATVVGVVFCNQRDAFWKLASLAPSSLAVEMTQLLLWIVLKIGAALFVLAILDYVYQWWRHEQDLKMTPQELREELQNLEGDPKAVARRKEAQRDLSSRRPQADSEE
jgi:flagellar biosynthetic protein FlhB